MLSFVDQPADARRLGFQCRIYLFMCSCKLSPNGIMIPGARMCFAKTRSFNNASSQCATEPISAQSMSLSFGRQWWHIMTVARCLADGGSTPLLTSVDGEDMSPEWLSTVLKKAEKEGQQPLPSSTVASVGLDLKTQKLWPQSHSAELLLTLDQSPPARLFLKKVDAKHMPAKSVAALRRDLESNRNEARWYKNFSAELLKRGVPLLRSPLVDERLDCLDNAAESDHEEETLRQGRMMLLLECVDQASYRQQSPLTPQQANQSLKLLAGFHAAAWEDRGLLEQASQTLHAQGCYWALSRRGEAELRQLQPTWAAYLEAFMSHAPDLLSKPSIRNLAQRLENVAPWVASQLRASPHDDFATLVHGDFKAMNLFLPVDAAGQPLLIDFQWTGVGYGMADVAMHLSHSVATEAVLSNEEDMVRMYHTVLVNLLSQRGAAAAAEAFSFETAMHYYTLAFLDYARMVISCFFRDASPESFMARSGNPNVGFVYRNVEASLQYIQMVDRHLATMEVCKAGRPETERSRSPCSRSASAR